MQKTLELLAMTTTENGNTTIERLQGVTISAAYALLKEDKPLDKMQSRKIQIDIKRGGNVVDVYSLIRAALQITSGAVSGAKDKTLERISAEMSTVNARLALPEYIDAGESLIINTLLPLICSQEARDIISAAFNGIWTAYAENPAAENSALYSAGYQAVNAHLTTLRRDRSKEVSREYIQESGGDMVTVNSYTSRIIYGGERYDPAPEIDASISMETRAAIGETISAAAAVLTLQQKKALHLSTRGYSCRQIAEKMSISKSTVSAHITTARAKIADKIAAAAEKAAADGNEQAAADMLEIVNIHDVVDKARALSDRQHYISDRAEKAAAANYRAAMDNSRYTYGKVYKQVERDTIAADIAAAEKAVEMARAEKAAAEKAAAAADTEYKKAAAAAIIREKSHNLAAAAARLEKLTSPHKKPKKTAKKSEKI